MFFSKKEKRKLPDLPSPPMRQDYESEEMDEPMSEHSLPAFPDSPASNNFSQVAIKDAVGGMKQKREMREPIEEYHPSEPMEQDEGEETIGGEERKPLKVIEMEEWQPSIQDEENEEPAEFESPPKKSAPMSRVMQFDRPRGKPTEPLMRSFEPTSMPKATPRTSDVFVKIDKFHTARRALGEIKMKLSEVDDLIRKIRDTKMREEQELMIWERDMEQVKARLREVTENIFEKID